jgi:two-component system, chemotaxis family, sensor kinase Cph1
MDDLIESLLEYSRAGRIDLALQPADLNDVVRGALDMFHARIEQSAVTLHVAQLPTVTCDRIRIREVFCNLILNAIKYNDRDDKRVEIGFNETPAPVYDVRDNGIGIETENVEEIFRIFRRLHGRDEYGGGTGAGLTIARKTVERHGGRIWVESTAGEGSTFYFTLAETPQAAVLGGKP